MLRRIRPPVSPSRMVHVTSKGTHVVGPTLVVQGLPRYLGHVSLFHLVDLPLNGHHVKSIGFIAIACFWEVLEYICFRDNTSSNPKKKHKTTMINSQYCLQFNETYEKI